MSVIFVNDFVNRLLVGLSEIVLREGKLTARTTFTASAKVLIFLIPIIREVISPENRLK